MTMPSPNLPLTHLVRAAAPGTGEPALLVLMHGVGSNERDLSGLAPQVPGRFHVLSLRAPHTLGPGAYAWFQFSVSPDGQRSIDGRQEAASRVLAAQAVAAAAQQLAVPLHRVVVGGFSQGGIMALSLLLTQPTLMQAAMVMHSRLLPELLPLAAPAASLQGKHLWVSHGLQDAVIPLASARQIRDHASTLPLALTYQEFPGAHEIRPAELAAALQWLGNLAG